MIKNEIIEDIKNGSLKFIDLDFVYRNDKEIVLAAMQQYGTAIRYLSDQLKNDKEIVLAAVKQNGWAIQFASIELQNEIGSNNPIKYLESYFFKQKLNQNLPNNNNQTIMKKIKI